MKPTRQKVKKEIKKELDLNKSGKLTCPVCKSHDIFHFYTKEYSYCNDCGFEYPLWY